MIYALLLITSNVFYHPRPTSEEYDIPYLQIQITFSSPPLDRDADWDHIPVYTVLESLWKSTTTSFHHWGMGSTMFFLVEKTRYRAIGRNKNKKGRCHRHCSRSPSTSPIHSLPKYRSKSRARRSVSRNPDKKYINTTNCPYCKEFGGYGIAHASPKSVLHAK